MSRQFDTTKWNEYLMKVNGLNVGLNMPQALASVGQGDAEMIHSLPPYHRRKAFLVDEYPACPEEWLRSSGRIKSYFVPIIEGNGLWFDFNRCLEEVPQHVAIVVSIQGVNAITGLPCKDPQLEQYKDECPKHKKAFGPDRLCKECGFKWPKQNYLSSTGTPDGALWLDGFRAEDGVIRQYVLTEQKARGVAKAVIGDDRVFALGVSFFLSKEKRPATPEPELMRGIACAAGPMGPSGPMGATGSKGVSWGHTLGDTVDSLDWTESDKSATSSVNFMSLCDTSSAAPDPNDIPPGPPAHPGVSAHVTDFSKSAMKFSASTKISAKHMSKGLTANANSALYSKTVCCSAGGLMSAPAAPVARAMLSKKLEIAAGARIDQRVYDDPFDLDYWQKEPDGIIVINYCTEQDAERIIAAGKVDLSGSKEGFLKNVPVGNPV